MYPIAPRPLFHGSMAASAKPAATAASTALPPAASISAPTSAARRCCEATMPRRERAAGLRTCQFCVSLLVEDECSGFERRALVEQLRRSLHAHELRAVGDAPLDEPLQGHHAMAAPDDDGVETLSEG